MGYAPEASRFRELTSHEVHYALSSSATNLQVQIFQQVEQFLGFDLNVVKIADQFLTFHFKELIY